MARSFDRGKSALRVLLSLFVLLFAITPTLEAAACAAEGCSDEIVEMTSVGASGASQSDVGCAEDVCTCAACHCSHGSSVTETIAAIPAPHAIDQRVLSESQRLTSAALNSLERPPRT